MAKFLHLIILIIFLPTYLFSETVIIYANQSAQYSANDCCTLNILTNQNSNSLYSQDCQDMGTYYGCGMSKHVPFWIFDLSILESSIDIQSIQFKGNLPTEDWSDVYLSVSTTIGQISTTIASDLWNGGDWVSGNGQYSSINWLMGDFSQNLPLEIISQGVISGQLNILTYTSNPWTIFSIANSGDDAPRLVIDYENIDEACTADDGTEGVELWGECYSIQNTTMLHLFYNELADTIPSEIGNLINLESLTLEGNELYGGIPSEIGNLTNLTDLKLDGNQLTGEIPSELGNLTNLTSLSLSGNNLTGEIPLELFSLVNLSGYVSPIMVGSILNHGLNLSDNLLSGEIPSEIGNLINLISINFSQNQFTGGIPSEIFNLINLESLNLSDNQLTGEISSEISNLINLSGIVTTGHMSITTYPALDLSENQFSGLIPESLCSLPIEWDYNSFGESEFSIDENQFCPLYPSCIEDYVGEQNTTNCEQVSIIDGTLPVTYNLYNAYPNPFNPVTTLQYDLPEDALVNITIYDVMGRLVSNLVSSQQNAGYKSIQWNATNSLGESVSAGLYLYTIDAGKFRQTKKMVLLK
jgi:Leucine-rich repeat (LRR) protein